MQDKHIGLLAKTCQYISLHPSVFLFGFFFHIHWIVGEASVMKAESTLLVRFAGVQ